MVGLLTILASSTNAQPAAQPNEKLPSQFIVRGEKLPTTEIDDPLISAEELRMFERNKSEYNRALRQGEITPSARKLIEEGIAARMLVVTIPEERNHLTQHRTVLMTDIKRYAGRNEVTPRLKRKFREMVLNEVLDNARKMLQNHQAARVFAIAVVKDLNIIEEDLGSRTPAEPYEPALKFMREVVNDPEQNAPVKIIALQGIKRILDNLKLSRNEQLQTAEDLVKELKDPDTHYWMQQNLIRALRSTQIDVNRSGQPFIVQTLAEVVSDAKRHPLVRAEAAYTIPRIPITNNVDLSVIAWQIAKLTRELADEYNKQPQHFWWQAVFFRLYAAFQPIQKGEGASEALIPISKMPAMAKHQAKVLAAYEKSLPVIKAVFDNRGGVELDQSTTVPLSDWLKENDPGVYTIFPGLPPVTQNESNTTAVNTGR